MYTKSIRCISICVVDTRVCMALRGSRALGLTNALEGSSHALTPAPPLVRGFPWLSDVDRRAT